MTIEYLIQKSVDVSRSKRLLSNPSIFQCKTRNSDINSFQINEIGKFYPLHSYYLPEHDVPYFIKWEADAAQTKGKTPM